MTRLENDNDGFLIEETLRGENDAFGKLAKKYYSRLFGWAIELVKDNVSAQDIVQETWLRAYRSLGECKKPDKFYSWLFGIAQNCAHEWRRNKKLVPSWYMKSMLVGSELNHQSLESLDEALVKLSPEKREILMLKYWKKKSCEEIAKELNKPIGTVMSLLSRTYKELKDLLGRSAGE